MPLLEDLRAEHTLIEKVLGSLRTYATQRAAGEADPADGARFVTFFRLFADQFHHAREEDVLFATLVREAEIPGDRGPIMELSRDHRRMRDALTELSVAFPVPLVVAYSRALWLHIDAEESVFFPESERRLRRVGIAPLTGRGMTSEEAGARAQGEALILRYAQTFDRDLIRGEGCVVCPHYGESCEGLEREWWNDNEWEEFPDRVG